MLSALTGPARSSDQLDQRGPNNAIATRDTITIGRISSKPARQYRNLDKLNRAMVDAMSDFGIGN
ncbi:MAG: hypothetical protein D6763_07105, partial [Alphaproteobacteria bacterium]